MTISNFLKAYWPHITAVALAFWNIYMHFKSRRIELKKTLEVTYLQLTVIINDFQSNILKLFINGQELFEIKINISEHVEEAMKFLGNVDMVKRKELTEKIKILHANIKLLQQEFELITDEQLKKNKRDEIEFKLNEVNSLLMECEEEQSLNTSLILKADELQKEASNKLENFIGRKSQRIISFANMINKFITDLYATPNWQITASTSIIKTIEDLHNSSLQLYTKLLDFIDTENEILALQMLVKSSEFIIVYELSKSAISKMRSEIYIKP